MDANVQELVVESPIAEVARIALHNYLLRLEILKN
jgi:hypothetical protein